MYPYHRIALIQQFPHQIVLLLPDRLNVVYNVFQNLPDHGRHDMTNKSTEMFLGTTADSPRRSSYCMNENYLVSFDCLCMLF